MERIVTLKRITKETSIEVTLNLDGYGNYKINTGISFLDHMLEQLSHHSLINIMLKVKGDLHIDCHHTVEDVGIVLGQALKQGLGERKGITRYADSQLVMDETLISCAMDISGRPYLKWGVSFSQDKIGEMDSELFYEWFRAFAYNAGISLHLHKLYGVNNHHIAETCFKALARTLKVAISIDPRQGNRIPSTKGTLQG
ncbi:MAG TPA: Histidine biosynthesis bifunctional protein HisB [Hyphomicrobiaceae bacterium MAG_BT-2024]